MGKIHVTNNLFEITPEAFAKQPDGIILSGFVGLGSSGMSKYRGIERDGRDEFWWHQSLFAEQREGAHVCVRKTDETFAVEPFQKPSSIERQKKRNMRVRHQNK